MAYSLYFQHDPDRWWVTRPDTGPTLRNSILGSPHMVDLISVISIAIPSSCFGIRRIGQAEVPEYLVTPQSQGSYNTQQPYPGQPNPDFRTQPPQYDSSLYEE
jgi:hypothetical protein